MQSAGRARKSVAVFLFLGRFRGLGHALSRSVRPKIWVVSAPSLPSTSVRKPCVSISSATILVLAVFGHERGGALAKIAMGKEVAQHQSTTESVLKLGVGVSGLPLP